jgi:hypothetical protein
LLFGKLQIILKIIKNKTNPLSQQKTPEQALGFNVGD